MMRRASISILMIWAAGLVILIALFFTRGMVATCLGGAPETRDRCVATWEAQRPWTDRFFDTPWPTLALLALLVVTTAVIVWRERHANGAGQAGGPVRSTDLADR